MTTVGVGQFSPTEHTAENIGTITALAERAERSGASLLVLPEYSAFATRTLDARVVEHAEALDGGFASALCDIARHHGIGVVAGMAERIEGHPRAYNTLLLVGADGQLASSYRKVHLYDAHGFRESDWIVPGEIGPAAVLDIDGVRFGAQTCYDLRFPESTRVLVDAGADVVIVAAQWVPGPLKEDHWTTLLRARAIENTVYVAAAGQGAPTGAGNSMIIDPMGVVVAGLGDRSGLTSAVIDPARIDEVRRSNPVLSARRFHLQSTSARVDAAGRTL